MQDEIDYIATEEIPMNNMAIFQQEKAAIEIAMELARKFPRNELRIKNACIALVSSDKELAASCTYSVPRSGNPTGPSVVLAKMILRKYSNVRAESRIVGFDSTHVTSEAMVADLETNYGIRVQVRRSIMTSKGARFDETTATTTGMAGCAIALRNAVFAVVDPSIVKAIHNAAKRKVLGKIDTKDELIAVRERYVNNFKLLYQDQGLTDTEIAMACGKKLIEHIEQDQLLTLAAIEVGLRSGDMDFDKVFRSKEPVTTMPSDLGMQPKIVERLKLMISGAKKTTDLEKIKSEMTTNELRMLYDAKFKELK